jgi:hypothetical protein
MLSLENARDLFIYEKRALYQMEAPQNSVWGPALWKLLHFSAERIGLPVIRLPREEERLWRGLLHSLALSLPCPLCKKHYVLYDRSRPLVFSKEGVRSWLYHLHEEVNQRLGSPSFAEDIGTVYGVPFAFSTYSAVFVEHMRRGIRHGTVKQADMVRTIRCLEERKRYYDFF